MLRLVATTLIAVTLLSTTACHMQRSTRTAVLVSGAAMTVAGYAVGRSGQVDADRNGINENPFDDDWGKYLLGSAIILGGLTTLVVGATAQVPARDQAPPTPLPQVASHVGPPGAAPGIAPIAMTRPLPEIATSAVALRMAQQARSAAARGNCSAAWATVGQIKQRDPVYGAALASGPVMADCPRLSVR